MNALFALIRARNIEFIRDRSALSWSLLFPVLLIIALAVVFDDQDAPLYRVGVVGAPHSADVLGEFRYLQLIPYESEPGYLAVGRHRVDLLLTPTGYAINPDNRQGYMIEQLLLTRLPQLSRENIDGVAVSHVEWFLPGIIGMNMMFSALFGIGYGLVRYRRTGVLKRLQVTPLPSHTYLLAQLLSRLLAIVASTSVVFGVLAILFGVKPQGSLWLLLLLTILSCSALVSLALLIASRTRSDELANGLLNLLSWPMMLLSGIWFSLDGSASWLQAIAQTLPLTHFNEASRAIITDGATLWQIAPQLGYLGLITFVALALASRWFRWQ
ncbi:ABC transporter permease [Ferrimonas balearica]|uniref:ABC transporter permease n=1 Tax=Ferrimonas balearica TaxID=44012 RepID=UPI001C587190|nr:ABC transporter permease [Ferrimonas balearica]MBW3141500.1 ABC transporter permease [Ferrimonas balearica]MBY6096808.1 ABC transporter permease [Ferrimonas balearica]MBY6108635.1 ABC transporter permease [Ferrimonas balearica]